MKRRIKPTPVAVWGSTQIFPWRMCNDIVYPDCKQRTKNESHRDSGSVPVKPAQWWDCIVDKKN